jgi:hypothetical protein
MRHFILFLFLVVVVGCGAKRDAPPPSYAHPAAFTSDAEKVRTADYSVLFIGNSHTTMHDLPGVVGQMIRFRHPQKTVYSHVVGVGFLEDVARYPQCREEVESRAWKFVVLQAQKESRSGRYVYSQAEGIEIAKLAKGRGADVVFYSEWGVREVPGHGARVEAGYDQMATASGTRVAAVGRAWDIALAARPELPLYDADGNHQSGVGAFLTAAVLFAAITGESPATLAAFPTELVRDADKAFLLDAAAKALAAKAAGP